MITVKRGDTLLIRWRFVGASGQAVDLAGCTARADVVNSRRQVVVSQTSQDGLSIQPEEGGVPQVGCIIQRVEAAVTTGWAVGSYQTDIEVTYPDGYVRSTPTLEFTVVPDVTR